jgi:hypothetical protein
MKVQLFFQHNRCDKIVNFLLDKQVKVCNTKSMIESSYIINNFIKKGIQVCVYMKPYYSLSEKGTI